MTWKKVISSILTLLLLLSMVIPVFAVETPAWVLWTVSQKDSKVTVKWGGTPTIRELKIFRDGSEFEDFTNIPTEGDFSINETESGSHKYKAIAYNLYKGIITESKECSVVGTGKPKITLNFKNHYDELIPKIDLHSYERLFDWVQIYNHGSTNLDLKKIKIRYFYTIDGEPRVAKNDPNKGQEKIEASDERLNPNYQFTDGRSRDELVSSNSVYNRFTRMAQPINNADYFSETYFLNTECKIYSEYNLKIQPSFHKVGLENDEGNHLYGNYIRNYDLTNDYSYNNSDNIAVYYDDVKIWGNDPSVIAPKNLSAQIYDFTNVKLNWTASPGADSYTVLRSESKDGIFSPVANGITGTSYNDSIPMPSGNDGKTYYYKVVANYGKIVSDDSNVVDVTAHRIFAPANLKAELNGNSVKLSWTPSAGAHSYIVKRSDSENGTYVTFPEGVTETSYIDSTITMPTGFSGKSYYYKVAAVCNSYVSDDSNSAGVSISGVTLDTPRNLSATVSDFNRVTLKWDSSAGANSYTIMRSTSPGSGFVAVKYGVTGTSCEDIPPSPDKNCSAKTYYYKVVAVKDGVGNSQDSEVASATVTKPAKPGNLTATVEDSTKVKLKWDASPGATGYIVMRSTSPDGTYKEFASSENNYIDNVPVPAGYTDDKYYYKVVAVFKATGIDIKSDESDIKEVIVPALKVQKPINLTVSVENFTLVKLNWNVCSGATEYKITRSESINGTYVAIGKVENTNYIDNILVCPDNAKTYYYKVVAIRGTVESEPSDSVSAKQKVLDAPGNLSANPVVNDVLLKWAASEAAQSYKVFRCSTVDGTYDKLAEGVVGTAWRDRGVGRVNQTTHYYYKVVAVNGGVDSHDSDIADVILKPYWNVECKIIKKTDKNPDFVIGSYIPVSFKIEFKEDTSNPSIILGGSLENSDGGSRAQLSGELVSQSNRSTSKLIKASYTPFKKNTLDIKNDVVISGNKVLINGSYKAGDMIYVEFVLKVKADDKVLNFGISNYYGGYGKYYKLCFDIQGNQQGDKSRQESAEIKIVKSDKLK